MQERRWGKAKRTVGGGGASYLEARFSVEENRKENRKPRKKNVPSIRSGEHPKVGNRSPGRRKEPDKSEQGEKTRKNAF